MRKGVQAEPRLCTLHTSGLCYHRSEKKLLPTKLQMADTSPPRSALRAPGGPSHLPRLGWLAFPPAPSDLLPNPDTGGQSLPPVSQGHGAAVPPFTQPHRITQHFPYPSPPSTNSPVLAFSTTAASVWNFLPIVQFPRGSCQGLWSQRIWQCLASAIFCIYDLE